MGKSEAARGFRRLGIPVFDADGAVHALLAPGGAAEELVEEVFNTVSGPKGIDRRELGRLVFHDIDALKKLETILHPLVRAQEKKFLEAAARRRVSLAVLDIPLLFETGGDKRCDIVAVVSAPPFVQRARVLRRSGMTVERMKAVLVRQMSDSEKRRQADYIILTGAHRRHSTQRIREIVRVISSQHCVSQCRYHHNWRESPAKNSSRYRNYRS